MHVALIRGESFRLFERFELAPSPGLNWIHGDNAAGKTSVLEAIHCLSRTRSFRGTPADLVHGGARRWAVQATLARPLAPADELRVQGTASGSEAVMMPGGPVSMLELLRRVPLLVLEAATQGLVEEGPAGRRRYLDWGVFHVEQGFLPAWRRYARALRQRNSALRAGAPDREIRAWHADLIEAGGLVHDCRTRVMAQLQLALGHVMHGLFGDTEWTLELVQGWRKDSSLAEALAAHEAQDRAAGNTASGPHRAELRLEFAGHAARHRVSRGQQKLLTAALVLAQAQVVAGVHTAPVLLLDDLPAELGADFQERLLGQLLAYPGQSFVTALRAPGLAELSKKSAVFHVEHGRVAAASMV